LRAGRIGPGGQIKAGLPMSRFRRRTPLRLRTASAIRYQQASLRFDHWFKEAAPSNELRKWFSGDATKWEQFRRRYFAETGNN
jgi:hypothetical protein